jgi:hypothetical protein
LAEIPRYNINVVARFHISFFKNLTTADPQKRIPSFSFSLTTQEVALMLRIEVPRLLFGISVADLPE